MDMDDTWVVAADGAHARFFKTDAEMLELTAFKELKNDHHAAAHRRGGANPDSSHAEEERRFAKQIAHDLDQADHQHRFRTLVLVAPPRFLGFVKDELGSASRKIGATVGKDIADEEVHALAKHLRKLLADRHIEDAR